jgi:hypothetical protein
MQTLYAMFDDSSLALRAVAALLHQGVRTADISVITKERSVESEYQEESPATDLTENAYAGNRGFDNRELALSVEKGSSGDSMVDAAAGAGIGLGVGLTAALISIAVPGFGFVLGSGALACAIASATTAAAAGAFAGGILGHFRDAGMPDRAAESFVRAYEEGWAIVAVEIPDGVLDQPTAEQILNKYQAKNINTFDGAATVTA